MNSICDSSLDCIIKQFKFQGKFIGYDSNNFGHINDTFIVKFQREDNSVIKYILQRINTEVFKDPIKLMENIKNITEHIRKKILQANGDPLRETLNIVNTIDGHKYYKDSNENYWRVFLFIDNARTYQKVENPHHMYTCGRALGKFQKYLADFPADILYEIIPDFHNTAKRYDAFLDAVKKDTVGRVSKVKNEIDFLKSHDNEMGILVDFIEAEKLPLRVTHNDTKFNNIMIDNITGEGIAVIDLDTVMPGLSLYDFGDSIRSGATTALEDEIDLSKVNFDINLFEEYTKGFLEEVGNVLTDLEKKYLAFSAKLITLECGMRFLTDYINGDTYFKIQRENHNLERARNQFKLVEDMEDKMGEMEAIVEKYSR